MGYFFYLLYERCFDFSWQSNNNNQFGNDNVNCISKIIGIEIERNKAEENHNYWYNGIRVKM